MHINFVLLFQMTTFKPVHFYEGVQFQDVSNFENFVHGWFRFTVMYNPATILRICEHLLQGGYDITSFILNTEAQLKNAGKNGLRLPVEEIQSRYLRKPNHITGSYAVNESQIPKGLDGKPLSTRSTSFIVFRKMNKSYQIHVNFDDAANFLQRLYEAHGQSDFMHLAMLDCVELLVSRRGEDVLLNARPGLREDLLQFKVQKASVIHASV